jgi:nucleotide-binding universal stress UspA family protein
MLTEMVRSAQKNQPLKLDLDGLTISSKVLRGEPDHAIVRTAQLEKADLIMMPSHGATFDQFLLGSVAMKELHGTECPLWTGAHVEQSAVQEFAIRNILCAVDLGPRSDEVLRWAAAMAAEFDAHLTVTHVTGSVELWGPGGDYVDRNRKQDLVGDASQRMAKLLQDTGTKADVLIGSGDVPKVLSHIAKQTNADLLVAECYPYGGNLRLHGYAIISAVSIPVLNV